MAKYIRKNAWNDGGELTNQDLFWYAKGVGKMMSRSLNDPGSWWYFAAIHGEYVNPKNPWYTNPPAYPDWGFLPPPPSVPTTPLPTPADQERFWNQCQHGSWFFAPWHRGYLLALEAQLRQDIISLGGPATWALPYWNYFGGANGEQYSMPPAFTAKTLPDGSANPLYVALRYGPDGDGKIYIPTPAWEQANPGKSGQYGLVTDVCLGNDLYTGSDHQTKPPGFGGPETGFSHSGSGFGNLESNPHNLVHLYVGGFPTGGDPGLMTDPGLAALDPIFYLHHAEIDRLWAVWNAKGNSNPTDPKWLNGPAKQFVMPWPGSAPWVYTPKQMTNLNTLDYTYQELPAQPTEGVNLFAQRLTRLGVSAADQKVVSGLATGALPKELELLGASTVSLPLKGASANAVVNLDPTVRHDVALSLTSAATKGLPDSVYLKLENVRGNFDAGVFGVYVNLPEAATREESRKFLVGDIAPFGLRRASVKDGQHAGAGLSFVLDITHTIDQLYLDHAFDAGSLRVSFVPRRALPGKADITVGRISVYRQAS